MAHMRKIDWEKQWELHTPNFKKGHAHINLLNYGGPKSDLLLKPGPGFGDLSHPTTQLMLHLMPKKISWPVIDIGCGSGILSIVARFLGAPVVFGFDIDKDALCHAEKNGALNNLDQIFFASSLPFIQPPVLVLMNMISSEQKKAWQALTALHNIEKNLIVSGILQEEEENFLNKEFSVSYGKLKEVKSLNGWNAFYFI